MHVVEFEPHGVIADRRDGEDSHLAFATDGFGVRRRVTLHLGAGAAHPQKFGAQSVSRVIVIGDAQCPPFIQHANFIGPGLVPDPSGLGVLHVVAPP